MVGIEEKRRASRRHLSHCFALYIYAFCVGAIVSTPLGAAVAEEWSTADAELISLESLVSLEVTSVSKKAQKVTESAAAIYVVTQEDIRRTGVTSLPEALRMVPGLQVARISGNEYAITSRGLPGFFADKMLVLMDGRSIYSPTFGGVFWDVQDTVMEDIDRIEVIRGPGATLWGANAVNGVVNIITKQARDTQGGLVVAGGGSLERAFATLRYGGSGKIGDGDMHYRVYGKANRREPMEWDDGSDANDDATTGRIGFRMDWDASERDAVTFQGDVYAGDYGMTFEGLPAIDQPPTVWNSEWETVGFNLIGRWTHDVSDENYFTLQSYVDKNDRDGVVLGIERTTFDIELQQGLEWHPANEFTWGIGYRVTKDKMDNSPSLAFDPDERTVSFYNLFGQNETRLLEEKLRLTLGAKLEYNDFVGSGFEPSARALYMIDERQSVWGAASGALQMGSRLEDVWITNMWYPGNPDATPPTPQYNSQAYGDGEFDSQEVVAFELGYRVMPVDALSLDITAFHNEYDKLLSAENGLVTGPIPYPSDDTPTAIIYQIPLGTQVAGWGRGVELAAQWQVLDRWRLAGAYTYLTMEFDEDSTTGGVEPESGNYPSHQWNLRSLVDLPANVQWDTMLYFVDELPYYEIDSYYRLDLRLGWKPMPNLDLSLVGQNLLEDAHQEWTTEFGFMHSNVPRSVYGKVTWEF